MNTIELTILASEVNARDALNDWVWLLNKPLKPIFLSKFGDWFFFNAQGAVEMLDMIEGQLRVVAASDSEFNALCKTPEKQSEWFLDGRLYRMHNDGLELSSGQCFGFKLAPILGGKFEAENIGIFSVWLYNSLCSQLHQQLRNRK